MKCECTDEELTECDACQLLISEMEDKLDRYFEPDPDEWYDSHKEDRF